MDRCQYVHARMTSQQLLPVSRASYQLALKRNDIVTCLKVKLHVHVRVHVHVHAGVHFLCIVHIHELARINDVRLRGVVPDCC